MENDSFFVGVLGIILGGVITYYVQVLHTRYVHKNQNRLDIKYLLLELERTKIAIESIYEQLNDDKETYLVDDQIKYYLNSDIYKNKYQFFLELPREDQKEYFLHCVLLIHGLSSLTYNLISGLSLDDSTEIKLHQKRCINKNKDELIIWTVKLFDLLLDAEKKIVI